jgi:hypothetical protein
MDRRSGGHDATRAAAEPGCSLANAAGIGAWRTSRPHDDAAVLFAFMLSSRHAQPDGGTRMLRQRGTHGISTIVSTSTIRKTAIALPAELLEHVDRAAHELGESRSRYITRILRCAVRARHRAAVTRRLDELFADPTFAAEQRRSAEELDAAGSSWNDERW